MAVAVVEFYGICLNSTGRITTSWPIWITHLAVGTEDSAASNGAERIRCVLHASIRVPNC